jgi:hypothetical protein
MSGEEQLARAVRAARARGPTSDQATRLAKTLGLPSLPPPPPPPAAATPPPAFPVIPVLGGAGAIVIASGIIGAIAFWPDPPRPAPPPRAPIEAPAVDEPEPTEQVPIAPMVREEAPIAREPIEPEPRVRRRAPAPVETPASRASEEAQLIGRAELALSQDPSTALRLANEHQRRFADGLLIQEREVIAIDALLRLGRRDAAEQRAAAFDRLHRGSVHSRRIHRLLDTR